MDDSLSNEHTLFFSASVNDYMMMTDGAEQ